MNTKQLAALWLGGLAIALLLASRLGTIGQAVGIALITAVLIYSIGSHPNADKRRVLLAVGIIAGCGAAAVYAYKMVHARRLRRKQKEGEAAIDREIRMLGHPLGYPINPRLIKLSGVSYDQLFRELSGRAENDSGKPVVGLMVHVVFRDARSILDEEDCTVDFSPLPAGETQGFEAACPATIDAPHGRHVFLQFHIISAIASGP